MTSCENQQWDNPHPNGKKRRRTSSQVRIADLFCNRYHHIYSASLSTSWFHLIEKKRNQMLQSQKSFFESPSHKSQIILRKITGYFSILPTQLKTGLVLQTPLSQEAWVLSTSKSSRHEKEHVTPWDGSVLHEGGSTCPRLGRTTGPHFFANRKKRSLMNS